MDSSQYGSKHHGVVHNIVTGQIGSVVQAGDVTGGIFMGDGPGPAVAQAGGISVSTFVDADVVGRVEAFLDELAAADLGQYSRGASELLAELRGV